ncbi:hypothetical protein N3K66_004931 [Trichothecium roseum]|uniref:Uncharacterized protein n=1 Tax=Trichothecium roseum TaxID=47278 RepID=A0ACC0V2J6_9HYPO|nr:hypothetical protein N3K66_004931 [Trichothecium roseum]
MKVTGVIVALAASAPMAAAIPFSLSSFLAPLTARAPAPEPVFPQMENFNLTSRSVNETMYKRGEAFIPQAERRMNVTFKA